MLKMTTVTEEKAELATRMIDVLVTRTIDDITRDEMNRIVRTLSRMPTRERGVPKRVADVLAAEIGPQRALVYMDKAFAAGSIKSREYNEMRAALILPLPRKEIPPPVVAQMSRELLETQQRLREEFRRLTGAGRQGLEKPFRDLDEDVKRIRKSWGL